MPERSEKSPEEAVDEAVDAWRNDGVVGRPGKRGRARRGSSRKDAMGALVEMLDYQLQGTVDTSGYSWRWQSYAPSLSLCKIAVSRGLSLACFVRGCGEGTQARPGSLTARAPPTLRVNPQQIVGTGGSAARSGARPVIAPSDSLA